MTIRPFILVLLTCIVQGGSVAQAGNETEQLDLSVIWNDPTFQKQFIGAYGINSDIEPRVAPEEVKILEKIRPLMANDLPKAEETLRRQMKPDCSAVLDFTLGGIHFQQGKFIDALVAYRKAVEKFPSFRRAYRNIGLIQTRAGVYDEAITAFTKMIELGGGDAYSYGLLGFAYASGKDYQAAEAAYRNALLLQPENSEWRLGLTRCVFKQSKFEDAATLLDGLIERYPDKVDFWVLQAKAYIGMKEILKAAAVFESLSLMGKATAADLMELGDIYLTEALTDLAAGAYVRAIDVDANQPLTRPIHAAEILASRGGMSQAKTVSDHIREVSTANGRLDDANQRRLLKLDARIAMSDGADDANTVAVLEEVIKLDPLDGEALMLLGQHYTRQSENDRAIFYYERAESIEAFEANAKVRHAQVLVSMGRYADAMPLLRRAQEIKPRDDVARYLEQIDRMSKSKK